MKDSRKKGLLLIVLLAVCAVLVIILIIIPKGSVSKKESSPKETSQIGSSQNETSQNESVSKSSSASSESISEKPKEKLKLINPAGLTLEERFPVPEGFRRTAVEDNSFQSFLRHYEMKPDKSPVLLYDGSQKARQNDHEAVFAMAIENYDLQQCADSVMRIYAEYFRATGQEDRIAFHFTNGFLCDYKTWKNGGRIRVDGNDVSWVQRAAFDDSDETFIDYLRMVFSYAGTISLKEESEPVDISDIRAGDIFIKGGSPGHVVMIADICEKGTEKAFLLAQGYMPAQEFHILKNPLHEDDPWYYVSELGYPFITPEYTFAEGSLMRPGY